MASRESRMQALGSLAPDFSLAAADGTPFRLAGRYTNQPFLVAFLCNHCPYVLHVLPAFVDFARDYLPRGLGVVAINSNDVTRYPADAPEHMAELASRAGFPFPYLYDESQAVALAYGAVCTPDFFLYDAKGRLAYRGQSDSSRPGNGLAVTGADLRAAADALLAGGTPGEAQRPSVGCSIKWRPDRAPDWA